MALTETNPENIKQYTGLAARILKFLIDGCTEKQAASAVGCDDSYVRHLILKHK